MLILKSSELNRQVTVLIFGQGLIGSSVRRALESHRIWTQSVLPFSWESAAVQFNQLEQIAAFLARDPHRGGPVHLLWSAGKAGFAASDEDTANEMRIFQQVVEFAGNVLPRVCTGQKYFHFVSSAGGLFEGRRRINNQTTPLPKRPYGHLKLEQERLVDNLPNSLIRNIYRPTSVYSIVQKNHRCGLIPALIWNTLRNRQTLIFGRYTTLRDFVWADDVGHFIANRMLIPDNGEADERVILASGTPTSILRVVRLVEIALMRPVLVHFSGSADNDSDITVDARYLPPDLHTTELSSAVRKICVQLLCSGLLASTAGE